MDLAARIASGRAAMLASLYKLRSVPPFLARYLLGITFVSTGWAKLHDLGSVTDFFASLGLPAPGFMASLVGTTELGCGGLLLLGLVTRLASIPLLVTMLAALATAKRAEMTSLPALFGMIETSYSLLLLYLAIVGPGALSVDRFLAHRLGKRSRARRASILAAQPA